ncbi:acetolactate synthase-1/2/3 large subunit [Roseiarcus fermentans]|uniref:Acetolactate synthase-1/2/3 large subunit n=1 Tax=Roseiarcus fermentans TaxID=1473586 RepID=A0A366EYH9_9HYPH|nr:thiamine pyrophosphate-binding protein [Roseiarcus fermentans]RBP06515.1 acetolactate synthase-1/2/3 large subunit [Roseiarcus fermentans]
MSHPSLRNGGKILVDQLVAQGVERVYCIPGESYLAALDAMLDAPIEVTVCRQEAGAAMMALTEGKLTGRPGICFVTRAPGATNAAHGLHIAEHDSAPMILFIGQVERDMIGRGAFQEMDYRAVFGSVAKLVTEIQSAAQIPEVVQRAFHVAMQGRPGPVVIALPEDMLMETAEVADAPKAVAVPIWPGLGQMAELQKMLWAAERPIAILGGGGWTPRASAAFARFAERFDMPVAGSFRRAGAFDGEHDNYAGEIGLSANPRLKARIETADVVLLVGGRMSEAAAQGYTLFAIPAPRQKLVHVHADPLEIGRNYHPALGIVATSPEFCAALEGVQPPANIVWSAETRQARADYLAWSEQAPANPGRVQVSEIMFAIRRRVPDAVFATGAGNFTIWVNRFLRFRSFEQQLGPTSGSMGYGLPAAIGAARVFPGRRIVCFSGDGDFLMNGQEFATAVQYGLPIIVVLIDNGLYGTIRMHQERAFPGRPIASDLKNPDFAAYARAFGGHGETVEETAAFMPAFERALAAGAPSIVHVRIDPEAITPATTLSAIRDAALARRAGS